MHNFTNVGFPKAFANANVAFSVYHKSNLQAWSILSFLIRQQHNLIMCDKTVSASTQHCCPS